MKRATLLAGVLVLRRGAVAQLVQTAVDVAVVVLVEMGERVDDPPRLLGGRGVVEIDEGLPVDLLVEHGKFVPDIGAQRPR